MPVILGRTGAAPCAIRRVDTTDKVTKAASRDLRYRLMNMEMTLIRGIHQPERASELTMLLSASFAAALRHDGGMKTLTKFGRDLEDLVAPVDLDRLARRIEHNFAVAATCQVRTDFFEQFRADLPVEVIG